MSGARTTNKVQVCNESPDIAFISSASVGQINTHTVQLTQSSGRLNQGRWGPNARHGVGHTPTPQPQPLQRVSLTTGNSTTRQCGSTTRFLLAALMPSPPAPAC